MNRRIILLLLFVQAGWFVFSQTKEDSLLKVLAAQKEDTGRVNTLNSLSWEFYNSNSNRSLQYAKQALKLAESLHFTKGLAAALNTIGIAYYFKGNYPEALNNYVRAARILEQEPPEARDNSNKKKLSALYNNIAAIFLTQSRYADAENYFLKSLNIDGELGDKKGMAQSYNNIGTIYKDLEQYEKALNYYLKALALRKEIHDNEGLPSTLTNIGTAYISTHNTKMGRRYLQDAMDLYRKNKDTMGIALTYNNLGDLHDELGELSRAAVYYDSSLNISSGKGYLNYLSYSYQSLSSVYRRQKKFEQALDCHMLYMRAKDSIYNRENADRLSELQTEYETEKKEKELKLQSSELQIKKLEAEEANSQKAVFRNFFIIFIVFTSVFVAILINRYKIKQKANKQLEEKNQLIAQQKDLVEQKQKEILDSIHYARRIQQSLLPNDKYIARVLNREQKAIN
jgi:tetratricopeptide (TPR) repeat protein